MNICQQKNVYLKTLSDHDNIVLHYEQCIYCKKILKMINAKYVTFSVRCAYIRY